MSRSATSARFLSTLLRSAQTSHPTADLRPGPFNVGGTMSEELRWGQIPRPWLALSLCSPRVMQLLQLGRNNANPRVIPQPRTTLP